MQTLHFARGANTNNIQTIKHTTSPQFFSKSCWWITCFRCTAHSLFYNTQHHSLHFDLFFVKCPNRFLPRPTKWIAIRRTPVICHTFIWWRCPCCGLSRLVEIRLLGAKKMTISPVALNGHSPLRHARNTRVWLSYILEVGDAGRIKVPNPQPIKPSLQIEE